MSSADMDVVAQDNGAVGGSHAPERFPPAIAVAEQLVRYAQRFPALHCYVLADPTLRDGRAALQARLSGFGASEQLSVTPVRLAPGRLDSAHWPLLIELAPTRFVASELLALTCTMAVQDWHADSLQQGNGHRIGGWLFSAVSAARLAAHLSAVCVQSRTAGRRTLIRFYDPSVLDLAWDDLRAGQREILLGPVDCWQVMGRHGALASYALEAGRGGDARTGEWTMFPGPSDTQWARLDQIGPLNRAWLRRVRSGVQPDADKVSAVRQALQRAEAYGFRDPDDLVEFAWRAFTVGVRFDSHARIEQRIRAGAPGDSFGHLMADLSEADWDTIGMESEKETGT